MREHILAAYKTYGTPALTNFRVENILENGTYEAGVFTLADIQGSAVLIRRKPVAGHPGIETCWWLPGGEREPGEALDATAVREFREETGLEVQLDRLLAAQIKEGRFIMIWFRGHVVGGDISPLGDPCNTTAEVRAFAPGDISVQALWSDVDKAILAQEGFISHSSQDLIKTFEP